MEILPRGIRPGPANAAAKANAASAATKASDKPIKPAQVDAMTAPSTKGMDPVERRVALFREIAKSVTFGIPETDRRGEPVFVMPAKVEPWQNHMGEKDPSVPKFKEYISLADALGKVLAGAEGGNKALHIWASSSRAHLWETPMGKALAHYALDRYSRTFWKEGRDKIGHAACVLAHADVIANEHEKRGIKLDPEWRDMLEYGAFMHDVGYAHGGFMHSGKGAVDSLFNARDHIKQLGIDVSQTTIEKLSVAMMLHGSDFPWKFIDQRLPGAVYIDTAVVEQIASGKMGVLKKAITDEAKAYLAKNPGGFKWLDDPKEMRNVLLTGWMMHCADKYLGEYRLMGALRASREGVRGDSLPLRSIKEVDKYYRDGAAARLLSFCEPSFTSATFKRAPDKDAKALEKIAYLGDAVVNALRQIDPTSTGAEINKALAQVATIFTSKIGADAIKAAGEVSKATAKEFFNDDVAGAIKNAFATVQSAAGDAKTLPTIVVDDLPKSKS
jgi:hypothetical protein